MKEIGNFFEKFRGVALKELQKRESIVFVIKKTTKQDIQIEDITIKDSVIVIKKSQGLKSEIFIKKQQILGLLKIHNLNFSNIK